MEIFKAEDFRIALVPAFSGTLPSTLPQYAAFLSIIALRRGRISQKKSLKKKQMAESRRQAKEQLKSMQSQLTTAGTFLPFSLLALSLANRRADAINNSSSIYFAALTLLWTLDPLGGTDSPAASARSQIFSPKFSPKILSESLRTPQSWGLRSCCGKGVENTTSPQQTPAELRMTPKQLKRLREQRDFLAAAEAAAAAAEEEESEEELGQAVFPDDTERVKT